MLLCSKGADIELCSVEEAKIYRLTPLPPTSLKLDVWGLGGPAGQMLASNGSSRLNYVNLLLGTWGPRGLNQLKGPAVGPYSN